MDSSLKACSISSNYRLGELPSPRFRERLSSLPDELLIRILCLLPTKYVNLMCLLLNKKTDDFLPWMETLDLDDSCISHCLRRPHNIHLFPSFVTFVDSVLQSHQFHCLTRFKLGVRCDFHPLYCNRHVGCKEDCFPDLKSSQINAWISFPLTRCRLRELDLCIYSREPCTLPSEIFVYETLEVLKLDVNLGFDKVSTFRLPKLKMLHLYASVIPDDAFLTRLVSSCPLLEELDFEACWNDHVHSTTISSPSLRRLSLSVLKLEREEIDNTDLVLLDTPNLEFFSYNDNVASQYSITNMVSLVEAKITIQEVLVNAPGEICCQRFLCFIRALSNVHHLNLYGTCSEVLNCIERANQLPVFHNLTHLGLGNYGFSYWNKVLVAFLKRSPNLETLVFLEGLDTGVEYDPEKLALERNFCKKTLAKNPWCCRVNLKRIEIKDSHGTEREVDWIKFLLRHCLVLEELVIFIPGYRRGITDETKFKNTLLNLPRASETCSIQVQGQVFV